MDSNIPQLIDKFFAGKCTAEEKHALDEWYYAYDAESGPDELVDSQTRRAFEGLMLQRINDNIRRIEDAPQIVPATVRPAKLRWITYAASGIAAMALIATGIYFFRPGRNQDIIGKEATNIQAAINQPMLTMSDGRTVVLDSTINSLTEKNGAVINIANNTLTYHNSSNTAFREKNVLTVPTGKTYKVGLADGTVVWLNNVSQLSFPVAFNSANERVVSLKGEAYFEVAHDATRPFKVNANGTQVTVLGTKFNVNAFHKQQATTALLEGSVSVSNGQAARLIVPGQQATAGQGNITVGKADLKKLLAWKDGYFSFKEDGIEAILEQVARWYNIEVKFTGSPSTGLHYGGKIPRSASLNEVLEMLTDITGLQFKHTGNTVLVNNK